MSVFISKAVLSRRIPRTLILLLVLMLTATMSVGVSVVQAAANYDYYDNGDGTCTIYFYDGTEDAVDIPSTLGGRKVTAISEYAFHYCSLKSVTIPNSVTSIGNRAFSGCSKLTSVTIPDSVTSIGEGAFSDCSALPCVTIPSGIASIGEGTFASCKALTSVTIPYGVASIGSSAFSECSELTSVTIPDSVTSIGNNVFNSCIKLKSVTIPSGVTSIGDSAFRGCSELTSVTIPSSVTSIGKMVFYGCRGLTDVSILDGVTSIGDNAYAECDRLTSVTIPGSVTSIGDSAFRYCSALTSVTLPNSITSIGRYAFYSCSALTNIYFDGFMPTLGNSSVFVGAPGSCTYYCPEGNPGGISLAPLTQVATKTVTVSAVACNYITPSTYSGMPGETISLNIAPALGYVFQSSSLKYNDGSDHLISGTSFIMPESDISISAVFEAKTISVGSQNGAITSGTAGSTTFLATTAYVADGTAVTVNWCDAGGSAASAPAGVSAAGTNIASNGSTIIVTVGTTAAAGTYYFKATADGITSSVATVTVQAQPTVTDVTVTPSTFTVVKGNTQAFSAAVTGMNSPVQTVTWSVSGNTSSSTTISVTGLLTVAVNETADSLTVKATSTTDSSKYGTATVTVTSTTPASIPVTSITVTGAGGTDSVVAGSTLQMLVSVLPDDATNKNVTWSVTNGSSVIIDTNGLLTAAGEGTATVRATAQDGSGVYGEKVITITDAAAGTAPVITTAALPGGTVGAPYAQTLDTTGSAVVVWSVSSGSLPDGLSLASDSGIISGMPMSSGTFNLTVRAENGWASSTKALSIVISPASNGDSGSDDNGSSSGNSGGGGSSGSSIPASNETYNAEVSVGGTGSTTLPITVDKDSGSAAIGISKQDNLMSGGQNPVITLPSIPGINRYLMDISVPSLSTIDKRSTLTVHTDTASITVPSNMLTGVAGANGNKAEISVGQGDKSALPEAVRAAIGDRPLISLSVSIDGKRTEWNNPDARVTVTIPYTPAAEELAHPESIVIWYIDGTGNTVTIPNGHYDSATGTVTFATTHFSDYAVAYNPVSFSDVAAGAWYSKAVGFIAARGITTGTGGGRYSPSTRLTRGEFIVLMMRAYGITPDTNLEDNFSDAGSTYYTGYLAAAKRLGISVGVGNNLYAPGKEITCQDMFTLLYNTLKGIGQLPQGDSGRTLSNFSDAGQISSGGKEAITQLVKTGTVVRSGGKLMPMSTTTRAEMAQVLYVLLSK